MNISFKIRLKVFRFINKNSEVCVCDIENSSNIIQSRISRHLKILQEISFFELDIPKLYKEYKNEN